MSARGPDSTTIVKRFERHLEKDQDKPLRKLIHEVVIEALVEYGQIQRKAEQMKAASPAAAGRKTGRKKASDLDTSMPSPG